MATLYGGLPASQLTLCVLLFLRPPSGGCILVALDNKLVCFSFIIHIDMNYKNEDEKYGITIRDLSFPFIKG